MTLVLKTEDKFGRRVNKKKNNDDLINVDERLPKVKSTIYSNPKFVGKSQMMSGANKFIGGTFRNTSLEQQKTALKASLSNYPSGNRTVDLQSPL